MRAAYIADVDDGLCMAIRTISGRTIQVDCGSTVGYWNPSGSKLAYDGLQRILKSFSVPNVLILSHFHLDHYNGLAYMASLRGAVRYPLFQIKELYYPGIPAFSASTQFAMALFTMNLRLLGDEVGIAEYELLRLVSRLNGGTQPEVMPLYQNDKLNLGHSSFTVIWPPRRLAEEAPAAKQVVRALQLFEKAMKDDEQTRKWHEYIKEKRLLTKYFDQGEEYHSNDIRDLPEFQPRTLPLIVEQANWALRKAANRLSLAFYEVHGQLLFLGDVMSKEIRVIVSDLCRCRRQYFGLLITPHHGTRWNKELLKVRFSHAVSSCGHRLFWYLRADDFKRISERHYATWINGDLQFVWNPRTQTWCVS